VPGLLQGHHDDRAFLRAVRGYGIIVTLTEPAARSRYVMRALLENLSSSSWRSRGSTVLRYVPKGWFRGEEREVQETIASDPQYSGDWINVQADPQHHPAWAWRKIGGWKKTEKNTDIYAQRLR